MAQSQTAIQRKLMSMIAGTSAVVLLLACAAFVGYEYATYRRNAEQQLATLSEVIAANSTAAMAFDNARDAAEVLGALRAEKQVVAACLYDLSGRIVARYPAGAGDARFPAQPMSDGSHFVGGAIQQFTPVVQLAGSARFGTLFLELSLNAMHERVRTYAAIAAGVAVVAFFVAYLLSLALQRQISRPILALAETARIVSLRQDYSVRAPQLTTDEIGLLTDTFNQMLAHIEEQNARLERRVRERTAELEAANKELEAFTSSAAHDLRTPLRAITGFADLILQQQASSLPPEVMRQIAMIRSGSEQMSQLIEALLSFSRLGRQAVTVQPIEPAKLCAEAWESLVTDRYGRRCELTLGQLGTVTADPALLRVVWINLLSNALKYSRPRDLAKIEVGRKDSADGTPTFYVRDNGVGFDMRDAAKLFGVFQRLHHAHEFEGTGVGLATVRRIVERHGGRIWAEAVPGAGATFWFTLVADEAVTSS